MDVKNLNEPLLNFAAAFLILVLGVVVLRSLANILQPLSIAVFFCYFAIPLRNHLVRWKISPLFANALVPVVFIGALALLGWLVTLNFQVLLHNAPTYQEQLVRLKVEFDGFAAHLHPAVRRRIDQITLPTEVIGSYLGSWVGSFFGFLGTAALVGFYMIFLLLESRALPRRLVAAYGETRGKKILTLLGKMSEGVLAYIRIKAKASIMLALLATFFFLLFRVDCWFLWGVLTFFGNFVPYLGAIFVSLPPVLVLLLQSGNVLEAGLLLVALIAMQNYMGAYFEPRLAGKTLNLSPLLVVVSLLFWAWLWGIVGMILAVPLLVTIKVVLEHLPTTKSFADLLGDHG